MSYQLLQTPIPRQRPTLVTPSCYGTHMHTIQDHLRLVEEAFRGRFSSSEAALKVFPDVPGQQYPEDGDVFVWAPPNTTDNLHTLESTSLILQDWDDGLQWLPPTTFGPYMVYYELPRNKPESTTLARTILPVKKYVPRTTAPTLGHYAPPPEWRLVYVIAYRAKCLDRTDLRHVNAAADTTLANGQIYWAEYMVPRWTRGRKGGWLGDWGSAAAEKEHIMPIHDPLLNTTEVMRLHDLIDASEGQV